MEKLPFTLRPAIQADAPAIRALIHAVSINPTGLHWQRFILAVDVQGQMIGCGQIKRHGDGSSELASIAVTPAWRGKGAARAMIERLVGDHPTELYLTCRGELGAFYERFGFKKCTQAEMPPYFRRIYRISRVIRSLRLLPGEMLVMKRPQPKSNAELHD